VVSVASVRPYSRLSRPKSKYIKNKKLCEEPNSRFFIRYVPHRERNFATILCCRGEVFTVGCPSNDVSCTHKDTQTAVLHDMKHVEIEASGNSSNVKCVLVAAGTCLPSRFLKTIKRVFYGFTVLASRR
jgi:hypothetical protein